MKEPNRARELVERFIATLLTLLLIIGAVVFLLGCTHTISLSDGDRRCDYQSKRGLDAESVAAVRTIVIDAAGTVRPPVFARDPKALAGPAPLQCDGRVCLSLDARGCVATVNR